MMIKKSISFFLVFCLLFSLFLSQQSPDTSSPQENPDSGSQGQDQDPQDNPDTSSPQENPDSGSQGQDQDPQDNPDTSSPTESPDTASPTENQDTSSSDDTQNEEKVLNVTDSGTSTTGQGSQSYKIDFSNISLKQYLRFKVESSSNPNQLVLVGENSDCSNRKAVGIQAYDAINLFVQKDQINQQNLYLCIYCQTGRNDCEYTINMSHEDKCNLSIGDQTNYFVNSTNTKMTFSLTEKNSDLSDSTTYIWVKANKFGDAQLSKNNEPITGSSFDFGKIFYLDSETRANYELVIDAEKDDYITIGSYNVYPNVIESKKLKVNNAELMGILSKSANLDSICYHFETTLFTSDVESVEVSGLVFTKMAHTYFVLTDQSTSEKNNIKVRDIKNGLIYEHITLKKNYYATFCITYSDDQNQNSDIIFSLQATSVNFNDYSSYIFAPQLSGVISSYSIHEGGIGVFRGMKPQDDAKEINYNMKKIKGSPDMLFTVIEDFPYTTFTEESIKNYLNLHNSNRITVFTVYINDTNRLDFNPLTQKQPLLIVHCVEGTNSDKIQSACDFETAIFTDKDRLRLVEEDTLSQYILEGQKDLYTINLSNEDENLEKVYIDLIVFSGDVNFKIDDSLTSNVHKYYSSNKIYYSITITEKYKQIDFDVLALKNSFYLVNYKLILKNSDSRYINHIESGLNYLVNLGQEDDMKILEFENAKIELGSPYLVNFYSENCNFNVSRQIFNENGEVEEEENIPIQDNYAQYMVEEDEDYNYDRYRFKVQVDEPYEYDKKLCMIYVTGLEYSRSREGAEEAVSVSEGVPQTYIYSSKYKYMKYTYYVSDINKELVADFNLIDRTSYTVKIIHNDTIITTKQVVKNQQIYLNKTQLSENCKTTDQVCPIDVYIELSGSGPKKLETTIYQVNGAPTYLQRNIVKEDSLIDTQKRYFYLDIGPDEAANITIDYVRGIGNIYVKVVNKTVAEEKSETEQYDWRGMYIFPKSSAESLPFDTYLKQITIGRDKTHNCNEGCYALITVEHIDDQNNAQNNNNPDDYNLISHKITIIPRVFPKDYDKGSDYSPIVKMNSDQFVLGNAVQSKEEILTFYKLTIPYDTKELLIDWQADKASLYINIGSDRPKNKEGQYDFLFSTVGQDTVFTLTKQEIVDAADKKGIKIYDSIKNVVLTIGIWTENVDNSYVSLYGFKITLAQKYEDYEMIDESAQNLIQIRSDQKVQCKGYEKDGIYSCIFAVFFEEEDVGKTLTVYPRAQKDSVQVNFLGNVVSAERVENNDFEYIYRQLRKSKSTYTSENGTKYIYYDKIDKDKCVLFSVNTTESTVIEVMSSVLYYSENRTYLPNPSSYQVFAIGKNKVFINFEKSRELSINIASISDIATFYWEKDENGNIKYYLSDFEDRLTLSTGADNSNSNSSLVIKSNSSQIGDNSGGFVFYMSTRVRNYNYNFDQIKLEKTTKFNYGELEFPLNYYAKLTDKKVGISFNLYDYILKSQSSLAYDKSSFTIWGKIITEKEAVKGRITQENRPKNDGTVILGSFDGTFASLYLNEYDIQTFGIKDEDEPYFFFTIEQNDKNDYDINGINSETGIINGADSLYAPEDTYVDGKLFLNNAGSKVITYELKTNSSMNYMKVEFAANSPYVKWAISKDEHVNDFLTIYKNDSYGKNVTIIQVPDNTKPLYLFVYSEAKGYLTHKLGNYIFKYMNGKDEKSFPEFNKKFSSASYSLSTENGKKKITIQFDTFQEYNIDYYVKGVYKDQIVEELNNTIAISDSDGFFAQLQNQNNNEGRVSASFEFSSKKQISYMKLIAKVNYNTTREYLYCDTISVSDSSTDSSDYYKIEEEIQDTLVIDFNATSNQVKLNLTKANKLQKYQINFASQNDISPYMRVRVKSSETNIKKVISFYKDNSTNYREDRLQLSESLLETTDLWVKKEQIKSNYLFTTVECNVKDNEKCSYSIEFEGFELITVDYLSFSYDYYVSADNNKMEFRINNNVDDLKASENSYDSKTLYLTLYATGGANVKLSLNDFKGDNQAYSFQIGSAIILKVPDNEYFYLTVEAESGDYISAGSKITTSDGHSTQNLLLLSEYNYDYVGYLKKNVVNKECYYIPDNKGGEISVSYITSIFYDKIAEIVFLDSDFKEISGTREVIKAGYYTYAHYHSKADYANRAYLCISIPNSKDYEMENLAYSIQINQPKSTNDLSGHYTPQLNNIIYPRVTPKGSTFFFNAAKITAYKEQISYNMLTKKGLPKMYISKCSNYPLCDLNTTDEANVIAIDDMNTMSTWLNTNLENYKSPISHEQYIMITDCVNLEGSNIESCEYETLIYGKDDTVELVEDESFSQYILKGRSANFAIDFAKEIKVKKVYIEIFVVNGEVDIEIGREGISLRKYYLSNKILYTINLNEKENCDLTKVTVTIKPIRNTYFTIQYKLISNSDDELNTDINTGINYLLPIASKENKWKKVKIHRNKLLDDELFLASFYSLNCRLKITRVDEDEPETKISSFVNYAQDIIDPNEANYTDSDTHSYKVNVEEPDISQYENNMCMLYVSGLDITKEKDSIAQKEILTSEGVPQKTVFYSPLSKVNYIYPVTQKDKNVAIFFKVINAANYSYAITYNNKQVASNYFSQSHIKYLDRAVIDEFCKDKELCNIAISLSVIKEYNNTSPIIEVTTKQVNSIPYYIPKGVAKQEYVSANSWFYAYTSIGQNDNGFATLDFSRGSGNIYAKIIEFGEEMSFPESKEDSLTYESYNKRIAFTSEDTNKCKKGCYLLMSVQPSSKGNFTEQSRFHQFTLTVSLNPLEGKNKYYGQIIQMEPEEYVIGALSDKDKINKKDMYQFYQMTIPYDADKLEFDWQCESCVLLINIGDERPTMEKFHFKGEYRSDTIFELKHDEVVQFLNKSKYITDSYITVGVYTEDYESRYGTSYTFRVHFSKTLNINKVTSDQKTLCEPKDLGNNQFRCLFMITYTELDFVYDLVLYSKSQSASAITNMYGDFIPKDLYDTNNITELEKRIPKAGSAYDTKRDNLDFIYLSLSDDNSYFYVSVVSDMSDIIEFITTFKTFDRTKNPDSKSIQLMSMNTKPTLQLTFETNKGITINLNNLLGYSKLNFADDESNTYSLSGRETKLSLATPDSTSEPILNIEDTNTEPKDSSKMSCPVFSLEYLVRAIDRDFDEISLGNTGEIAYKKTDFPLYYYSKTYSLEESINIFYVFHNLTLEDSSQSYRKITSKDFNLKASIISQKTAYLVKTEEQGNQPYVSSTLEGRYDPSIQVGQIILSPSDLQSLSGSDMTNPTLYLTLENQDADVKYNKIGMEISAVPENKDITIPENIYQYGKINGKGQIKYYRIKVDNSIGDMRIQFSANSRYLDFAINYEKNVTENMTLYNQEFKAERGKLFLTFTKPNDTDYIYFNVFLKEEANNTDARINNYVFKYMSSTDRKNFVEYLMKGDNDTITITETEDHIKAQIYRLDVTNPNVTVTYSLKVVDLTDISSEECVYTIAMIDSECSVTQIQQTGGTKSDKIILQMDYSKNYSCINVIAQVHDGSNIEYESYKTYCKEGYYGLEEEDTTDDDSSKKIATIWISVAIALVVVIIVVVVILIFCYKRNKAKKKDLAEEINKVSFAENDDKDDDKEKMDSLLLEDEKVN